MTYNEESFILDTLEDIKSLAEENNRFLRENNVMLKQIISFIKNTITNHHKENEEDFIRNVLANMLSTQLELFKTK